MRQRASGPPAPPQPLGAVVLPGHRPTGHSEAYRAGVATYRCVCGAQTAPAPPTTAAALWREHLEINMVRSTMLSGSPGQFAGRSIFEMLWAEMDAAYAALLETPDKKKLQGQVRGLATAIALMTNPYAPSVEAVAEEAQARWENAHPDEEQAV